MKRALHELANRNWVREVQLGPMTAMRVSQQYEHDRVRFREQIEPHGKKIAKAVDLFSRIKSTEQAEEVLTVLFASREVKHAHPAENVAEQQLFDYILAWKTSWQSEAKRQAVASAIRNLVLLGWMRLSPSASLAEAAGG